MILDFELGEVENTKVSNFGKCWWNIVNDGSLARMNERLSFLYARSFRFVRLLRQD